MAALQQPDRAPVPGRVPKDPAHLPGSLFPAKVCSSRLAMVRQWRKGSQGLRRLALKRGRRARVQPVER